MTTTACVAAPEDVGRDQNEVRERTRDSLVVCVPPVGVICLNTNKTNLASSLRHNVFGVFGELTETFCPCSFTAQTVVCIAVIYR